MSDLFSGGSATGYIVAFILGVLLFVLLKFTVIPKHKRVLFLQKPSLLYLHDFLHFRIMWTLAILKFFYGVFACILTVYSFVAMFDIHFLVGLLMLTLGNLFLRLSYEFMVMLFSIHENTSDIANFMTGRKAGPVNEVSAGEFFGDVGKQLKAGQAKLRTQMEEARARQEAEQQRYEQQQQQYNPAPQAPVQPVQQEAAPSAASGAARFCKSCGAPLDVEGAFCSKCGTPK